MVNNHKYIQEDFDRAAKHYLTDKVTLQSMVADSLIEEIKAHRAHDDLLLDLGCGAGYLAKHLPNIIQADLSFKMCETARHHSSCIQSDIQNLPFAANTFSTITSSMALHWVPLKDTLAEIHNLLAPKGTLFFSIPVTPSLQTLNQWGLGTRIHSFASANEVVKELTFAKFSGLCFFHNKYTFRYKRIIDALKAIRTMGGANKKASRTASFYHNISRRKLINEDNTNDIVLEWNILFIRAEKHG